MLFISWLTFAFEASSRGERNDLSMATLLASIANKYVVGDQLPKVEYRTLVDVYVETCYFLQVFTVVSNALVCHFNQYYQDVQFPQQLLLLFPPSYHWILINYVTINNTCLCAQLFIGILLHDWLFTRLYNHDIDKKHWLEDAVNSGFEDTTFISPDNRKIEIKKKKKSWLGIIYLIFRWGNNKRKKRQRKRSKGDKDGVDDDESGDNDHDDFDGDDDDDDELGDLDSFGSLKHEHFRYFFIFIFTFIFLHSSRLNLLFTLNILQTIINM